MGVPSPIPWAPCTGSIGLFSPVAALPADGGTPAEDNPSRFLYVDGWASGDSGPWSPTRSRGLSVSTPLVSSLWADDPEVETLFLRHRFAIGGVHSSGAGRARICFVHKPCPTESEDGDWTLHLESATYSNQFGFCSGVWLNGAELERTWGDPVLGVPYGTPVAGSLIATPSSGNQPVSFVDCVVPFGFDTSDAGALDPPVYELLSQWEFHGTVPADPDPGYIVTDPGSAYDELGNPARRVWFWFGGATALAFWHCGAQPRGGGFHFG